MNKIQIASVSLLTLLVAQSSYAEPSIVNFQSDSIVVSAKLSTSHVSRNIGSAVYSPSRMPVSEQSGNIAPQIAVGYVICELNKRTNSPKTIDSIAHSSVIAGNRPDTEIKYSVTFPELSPDWVEKQNKFAMEGGCGYFQEPKMVSLNISGTVPFTHLDPMYVFSDTREGYTLRVEVKPLNN